MFFYQIKRCVNKKDIYVRHQTNFRTNTVQSQILTLVRLPKSEFRFQILQMILVLMWLMMPRFRNLNVYVVQSSERTTQAAVTFAWVIYGGWEPSWHVLWARIMMRERLNLFVLVLFLVLCWAQRMGDLDDIVEMSAMKWN